MKNLLIGAAVTALAFSPLAAQGNGHGGGHGNGNGGGHGNAAHGPTMQGPSMAQAAHGNSGHSQGSMASAMEPQHGKGGGNGRGNGHGAGHPNPMPKDSGNHGRSAVAHEGGPARPEGVPRGHGNGQARIEEHGNAHGVAVGNGPKKGVKVLADGRRFYTERGAHEAFDFSRPRGLIDGCPPGLAKKNNGCQPPGLAKQNAVYRPEWWGMRSLASGPYIYDDGYLVRLNGDRVASYVPLFGGALGVGNIWPSTYAPMPVPPYYVDYYDLGPANSYRYADNVLYRVDPTTSAINSIAALLTGDTFQIGSPLPPGYGVYNVPYQYRTLYPDSPTNWYRYSDGYIYQVDPTTQLVTAAIDLLAR